MNVIKPSDFCPINQILTGKAIFVIPNFQRPYVWGNEQFEDLFHDLEKSQTREEKFHYLSSIHVLELDKTKTKNEWNSLIDESNEDSQKLSLGNTNLSGVKIPVYAVVDGQQRLTTLFLLAHVLAKIQPNPGLKDGLFTTLQSGIVIPRLIQNPASDHTYMQQLLADYHGNKNLALPSSAAQKRLKNGLELTESWVKTSCGNIAIRCLLEEGLQTSVIQLDAHYGLTSFLTLNDRGKSLTVLERLKASILQAVFESETVQQEKTLLANKVHGGFTEIYKILDKLCHGDIGLFHENEQGDQEMVQLFSCYIRLKTDADSIWQSGDAAYDKFFRPALNDATTNVVLKVTEWMTAIEEISEGLNHLHTCLTPTAAHPSIFFPHSSSLEDDYRAIFLSLKLQPHLLALLLKFRALTKEDWHRRFPVHANAPTAIIGIIQDHIDKVRREVNSTSAHNQVNRLFDELKSKLENIKPRFELSMLEVVERLQILNWNLGSRRNAGFIGSCHASLVTTNNENDIVSYWFSWCNGYDFIVNVLNWWNEPNFRYLLREMERELGQNVHFNDDLQLEHILPQNPDSQNGMFANVGGYSAFGCADKDDYTRQCVSRSGNMTWLTQRCNGSLGNDMPDVKAAHYISCHIHSDQTKSISGSADIKITHKVGTELLPIGANYGSYKPFISARCAELALFAVKRFI
jgi:hypothetical protein